MSIILLILFGVLIAGVATLLYLSFWVWPRIKKIYDIQTAIADLVYARPDWDSLRHLCNRDTDEYLEYRFCPINMRTFLEQEEIDLLTKTEEPSTVKPSDTQFTIIRNSDEKA